MCPFKQLMLTSTIPGGVLRKRLLGSGCLCEAGLFYLRSRITGSSRSVFDLQTEVGIRLESIREECLRTGIRSENGGGS